MTDPNNPSGTLPGDPRYGLTEEQLKEYYRNSSQTWIIRGYLKTEGGLEAREAAMEPHLAFLRANRSRIRFAGPTLADDGVTPTGSLTILDAPTRDDAVAWLAEEPYMAQGALAEATYTRFSSSMQHRQLDYDRTPGWQQFMVTCFDGPDGEERRHEVAEEHHKFQATVMDRYVVRGPMFNDDGSKVIGSFFILELPDRAAAEDFMAREPLNYGGAFESVAIECWRYGKGIG